MDQRGISAADEVTPGKTVESTDVFEVPQGSALDAVWISRDQTTVLFALSRGHRAVRLNCVLTVAASTKVTTVAVATTQ